MSSRHLIDIELLPALEVLPALDLSDSVLPTFRAGVAASLPAPPEGTAMDERFIPGPAGGAPVRVLVYQPKQATPLRPALLHIHGGGYVLGQPEMNDAENRMLSEALGCVVVSVDYRLAPEHPYPAAIEDCYAALKWLAVQAQSLSIDPQRIAITGESAGGGLAAALALLARDRNEVRIAFQLLFCPMLDDRTAAQPQRSPYVGEFVWTHQNNHYGWSCLLGHAPGGDAVSSYAAAARAADLTGLPATYLSVSSLDLFLDENLDYARRLAHAGVPMELHVYPGAFHGFTMAHDAHVSALHWRDCMGALRRAYATAQA